GVPLTAGTEIVVDSRGPSIECDLDGRMVEVAPGGAVTMRGSVSDPGGVATVVVDGSPVPVGPDGSFEATVAARAGMNFVEVVSTDTYGIENGRVCTFL